MDDLISRQAAIEEAKEWIEAVYCDHDEIRERMAIKHVINGIKELPPAQPKRGKWIYCEDSTADCVDGYRCNQCGFFVPWDYTHKSIDYIKSYNCCPHCGADMREVTE